MTTNWLAELFERDFKRLKHELESYKDEKKLWIVENEIANSAGNLILHMIGNLNHFIGATLGGSGYIRERDKEFSQKNVSKAEMMKMLEDTQTIVIKTLNKLHEKDLVKIFPIRVWGDNVDTGYFLIHLATHLNYHLGQINYHRRLLDG